MTLGICAIFKDEARYIEEWVAYHFSIGFDHFYLYDNGSSDGTADLLATLPLSRSITVIDWPERPGQLSAYAHFCETFAKEQQWIAFIDIDEFLFILGYESVKDFIAKFDGFAAVLIHWLTFGSSGFGGSPTGLVLDNYVKRSVETNSNNLHVKTLVRSACLLGVGTNPHVLRVTGRVCDAEGIERKNQAVQTTVCHTNAVICHYVTKSYEDWLQKLLRGKATSNLVEDAYPLNLFFQYDNPATITDTRMRQSSSVVRSIIGSWRGEWRRLHKDLLVYRNGSAYIFREAVGRHRRWLGLLMMNGSQPVALLESRSGSTSGFISDLEAQLEVERHVSAASQGAGGDPPCRVCETDSRSRLTLITSTQPYQNVVRRCVFHSKSAIHWGGLMMRYMAALQLKHIIPQIELSNFDMPQWGITCPALSDANAIFVHDVMSEQHVDFQRIAYLVRDGLADWINWSGCEQRLEYFPAREICQKIYSTEEADKLGLSFGHRYLVCPITGVETLDVSRSGHVLVPAEFYREIADQAGLQPVFIGETDDNAYISTIRAMLPDAIYLPSQGPMWDFQTVRKSQNIVVSVSTSAWLAAWLSNAGRIFMPVYGLFNPRQFPYRDLLPLADERYRYYEFPISHAVPVNSVPDAHRRLRGKWVFRDAQYFARF